MLDLVYLALGVLPLTLGAVALLLMLVVPLMVYNHFEAKAQGGGAR